MKIPSVLSRTNCAKHKAALDEPCFRVYPSSGSKEYLDAICNERAKRAGYFGHIKKSSIRLPKNGR